MGRVVVALAMVVFVVLVLAVGISSRASTHLNAGPIGGVTVQAKLEGRRTKGKDILGDQPNLDINLQLQEKEFQLEEKEHQLEQLKQEKNELLKILQKQDSETTDNDASNSQNKNKKNNNKSQSETESVQKQSPEKEQVQASSTTSGYEFAYPYANEERVEALHRLLEPQVWDFRAPDPMPCYEPNPSWAWEQEFSRPPYRYKDPLPGMYMTKPYKVGGSTAAGIHLRIMHQLAPRLNKTFPVCRGNFRHQLYRNPGPGSFLWTVVREPTTRSISDFFHFGVSRKQIKPSDANFLEWVRPKQNKRKDKVGKIRYHTGYYAALLSIELPGAVPKDPVEFYQSLLQTYSFIAVTERMDESIVVLKELLGLRTSDVLYLSAKSHGGWDDGASSNGCTFIVPSYVSPGMQEHFASDEWLDHVQYDVAFHAAINRSLDLTIDQRIGREKFQEALLEFQQAQRLVQEQCQQEAMFPCSPGGVKRSRKRKETNCYYEDSGCGHPCIDRVVKELGL